MTEAPTMDTPRRILVLGASGMMGHAAFRLFGQSPGLEAWGTLRSPAARRHFGPAQQPFLLDGVEAERDRDLASVLDRVRPHAVLNCVGIVKQRPEAQDALLSLAVNAVLPHRLALLCRLAGARLIHLSTDCVFTGARGAYRESDPPDAPDLYGRTKLLGEVQGPGAITLRTSIIGHEPEGVRSLVDWFLSQPGPVKGYRRAIFSGLPTTELARVIRDHVLPDPTLSGLWHVSAEPIAKLDLLRLVAQAYGHPAAIEADDSVAIDRSLDSSRFRAATGYRPPAWPDLVALLRASRAA